MLKVETFNETGYRLVGFIDLANLMRWRTELEAKLPADSPTMVDLSGLEFDGSAILALLTFLTRRAKIEGGAIEFANVSDRLRQMIRMADLSTVLVLK